MSEVNANSALLMDRGIPLGNSLDVDARRALHTKIKNTPSEPIPVTATFSAPSFGSGSPQQLTVGTTDIILVASNAIRQFLRISNYTTQIIWLQYNGAAVVGFGQRLVPGAVFEISPFDLFTGDVHALAEGSSVTVGVFEGST